ncbi:glycosyltransferase [Marinifilum sp. N1E240]|uniref:glycosyltransferase family 4 protein n=1 Tax=Marinifilum sp. N1E240 TaxID=2608082 RepID=UPI00128E71B4|nr:glycosyltransferase family 4 protein [Marinifilum sp. N1E240]MPQ46464.1 glycosyltransferase [Marinifilum sp. N1E240]
MGKSLFIIVNVDWFFLSHRLPIALAAKSKGYEVTILAGETGKGNEIKARGLNYIPIPLQRSGTNPFNELRTFVSIFKLILKHKPDVVHNVALKTCCYGGIATRFLRNCITINAVSGLGYVFTTDKVTFKQRIFSRILRFGFHNKTKTIFQNPDDLKVFNDMGILNNKSAVCLIKGSGVDISNTYKYMSPISKDYLTVLFPARMLYTKGVEEFCLAAKKVREHTSDVRFILVGDNDSQNRSSVSSRQLRDWERDCGVEWKGYNSDMISEYIKADIVVLPSYREGLPKSLIEACAIGRPIVTTNAPGCKECVGEGVNGYLIPMKNVDLLAKRILQLLMDSTLRESMGLSSRKLAERDFSINTVIDKTIGLYE